MRYAHMNIYEHNFRRLASLSPVLADGEGLVTGEWWRAHDIVIEIVERHRYTTIIALMQRLPLSPAWLSSPSMQVCIYHDACLAEVLTYQDQGRFQPRYDYPNPRMRQIREKRRVNEFLAEWLEHCLGRGSHTLSEAQFLGV